MSTQVNANFRQLRSTLLSWRTKAFTGNALTGLGEAIEIIDALGVHSEDDEEWSEKGVTLTLGFEVRGEGYSEGVYASVIVSHYGVIFDDLRTQYSAEGGSDHFSSIDLRFEPVSTFQFGDISDWLSLVNELMSDSRTVLEASRDYI
jgi:hypothetical protein